MANGTKKVMTVEYGDFQTPLILARQVCELLQKAHPHVASIIEPTCGVGNFLLAALDSYPSSEKAVALEINPSYVASLRDSLAKRPDADKVQLECGSFFSHDWMALLAALPEPILLVGNPPWVTNAALGRLKGGNLPVKANLHNHRGIDALTGKSNFDISEWMLSKFLSLLAGRDANMAMLCKRSVARKVLSHAWRRELPIKTAAIYGVDAGLHFDAAVEACLLYVQLGKGQATSQALQYDHIASTRSSGSLGYREGMLVSDVTAFDQWRSLLATHGAAWRSGIKHDCSAVMELTRNSDGLRNGLGECMDIEDTYLYPMLKSSDVAHGEVVRSDRWMLVPQRAIGQDTGVIKHEAPKTWEYLQLHREKLGRRGSSIYRNRPLFSVFGVGDYSFSPWKIAISGLYKSLDFRIVGPVANKPVVFDDTCYFLPSATREEAEKLLHLLKAEPAQKFLKSLIFWDAKRPITVDVLRRLDLERVADLMGMALHAKLAAGSRLRLAAFHDNTPTLFG